VIPCVSAAGSFTSVRKGEIRGLGWAGLKEHELHTGLLGSLGFGEFLEWESYTGGSKSKDQDCSIRLGNYEVLSAVLFPSFSMEVRESQLAVFRDTW
jgi:hypothetical protein